MEGDLADLADDLVPGRVSVREVAEVVRLLRRIERRAGGARLLLAAEAASTGLWRQEGFRSPEEWAARRDGTTTAEAKADLKAAKQLDALPAARDAVAGGEVSAEAARAVAEGASADPKEQTRLLDEARSGDLGAVRDRARRARQRADERSGRAAERMHRRRSLRCWSELDGEGRGAWNVPPGYQTAVLAALEPYRQQAFLDARSAGRREAPEALMADALYLLARDIGADLTSSTGAGSDPDVGPGPDPTATGPTRAKPARPRPTSARRRRPPAQVYVHVDYDALVRGHATGGETCEVTGVGPVPVALARYLATDATLHLLLTGTDVTVISSHKRHIPAAIRRALEQRDKECVVPGCHRRHHLEIDHWQTDFAADGPTRLANLARLCGFHHSLKTHAGWRLAGGPDHWQFLPPGRRPPPDEPP